MNKTLIDIRQKLSQGAYKNEEHVRLNLVSRVLFELGWNIWDPAEVNAELTVAPAEDKTKVDLALFLHGGSPAVFVEIKAVGKIALPEVERQLRDYNRNLTAKFSVITDGREWRFYLIQTDGEFFQKCFKKVDLSRDDPDDAELVFREFLEKGSILSGRAQAEAEKYLQQSKKQRTMDDCLSEARRKVNEPPFHTLPECLVELVAQKGFEISREEAAAHISSTAPLASSPLTASLPAGGEREVAAADRATVPPSGHDRQLPPDSPGDLKHSRIIEASFAGQSRTEWNPLLDGAIGYAVTRGVSYEQLCEVTSARLEKGNRGDKGYHQISGADLSIQGMDSNRVAQNLVALAKHLKCSLRVRVRWSQDSPFAGQTGLLEWLP